MKKLILTFTLLLFSVHAHAATYYVSTSEGNDTNNGTSTSTPWQTMTKVGTYSSATGFNAGDSILFKCGDVWNYDNGYIAQINFLDSGQSGSPIILSSYGDCNPNNKPKFDGFSLPLTGSWAEDSTNVWRWDGTIANTERVLFDGLEYNGATSTATITDLVSDPSRPWYFHFATAKLYIYSTQDPDSEYTGDGIQVMRPEYMFNFSQGNDYITISGLELWGAKNMLNFQGGDSSNIKIINNKFRWMGFNGIRTVSNNVYSDWEIGLNDMDFLYDPTNPGDYLDPDDRGPEDTMALYGTINNFHIHHNTTKNSGHSEISLDSNSGSGTIIEGNDFSGPTSIYARGFGIAGENVTVRNNRIHDVNIRSQVAGTNNNVYNNIFDTVTGDGNVAFRGQALLLGTVYPTTNNKIYNNTFINCFHGCVRLREGAGGDVSGNIIKNNLFIQNPDGTESTAQTIAYAQMYEVFPDVGTGDNTFEYNYLDNSYHPSVIKVGATWYTVSSAEAAFSAIANNYSGTVTLNDFNTIESSDDFVDIGTTVDLVIEDYRHVKRPQGSGYDIGAYEVGGSVQTRGVKMQGVK